MVVNGSKQQQQTFWHSQHTADAPPRPHLNGNRLSVRNPGRRKELIRADGENVRVLVFGRLPESEIEHPVLDGQAFDIDAVTRFPEAFSSKRAQNRVGCQEL